MILLITENQTDERTSSVASKLCRQIFCLGRYWLL